MPGLDPSHDPKLTSWVASANGHEEFPIQNLPLGIFRPKGGGPRGGVAIGDQIFDLAAALDLGLFSGEARLAAEAAAGATLNPFFALPAKVRSALRQQLVAILRAGGAQQGSAETRRIDLLHLAADCRMDLPAAIGDYTDFYAGIAHATNVGTLLRPDNPLMPNYKYVPVGYHGRASSVVVSATPIRRPNGQRKARDSETPEFGPTNRLDFELELGIWLGPGNELGEPIPIGEAADHIAGYCLLNDWSARDIQGWEAQPLGPFLAKNFASTVSPWVILPEALAPFRTSQPVRPEGDPPPLPYLLAAADQHEGALDITLEAFLQTPGLREKGLPPQRLTASNALHLYWTPAQMVAHHSSGGCNLKPGDLFGSGTVSSPSQDGSGSLLEITSGWRKPVVLASGETRRGLEDGDEVIFRAGCRRTGFVPIGFGSCRGTVTPAASPWW